MNIPNKIAKIDAELKKTRKLKELAEAEGNRNIPYWVGYEEGLMYARQVFITLINRKGMKS
jgi:hypothetical protein